MSRVLRYVVIVAALGAALWFYHPTRLGMLVLAGRSQGCPWRQALQSTDNAARQIELKDRILKEISEIEKDPAGFHLWRTPNARYWMPAGSDYVLPWNLAEQERKIYGTGELAVRPGDVVLDCGANVGVYVREALNAGAKQVVAIEPGPENIECLRRNFPDEIAAGRVIVYGKGVWDRDDWLLLNVDPKNSAADSFVMHPEGASGGLRLPLTTIDKLVDELNLERVDYIKMDIEGAEQRALAGALKTMAAYHPRLAISAYHRPDDPAKIPEIVRAVWPGYRTVCGVCSEVSNSTIRPDVLFFLP
ncbi:MAG: FkbM family methyltransferase [Acidobacteriales bacterium]|nr:FkbM family methyltransferase [Terriglobales bacterium]